MGLFIWFNCNSEVIGEDSSLTVCIGYVQLRLQRYGPDPHQYAISQKSYIGCYMRWNAAGYTFHNIWANCLQLSAACHIRHPKSIDRTSIQPTQNVGLHMLAMLPSLRRSFSPAAASQYKPLLFFPRPLMQWSRIVTDQPKVSNKKLTPMVRHRITAFINVLNPLRIQNNGSNSPSRLAAPVTIRQSYRCVLVIIHCGAGCSHDISSWQIKRQINQRHQIIIQSTITNDWHAPEWFCDTQRVAC